MAALIRFEADKENTARHILRSKMLKDTAIKHENQGLRVLKNLDLNKNDQGKPCGLKAQKSEGEVKAITSKLGTRNFKNVQSKIDTGIRKKTKIKAADSNQVPVEDKQREEGLANSGLGRNEENCRSLRREESTASHAHRAAAIQAKVAAKEVGVSKETEIDPKPVLLLTKKAQVALKLDDKTPVIDLTKAYDYEDDTKTKYESKLMSSFELPDGVDDVDADDENRALAMSDYVKDIYDYLRYLESGNFVKPDHLKDQIITPTMRAILVDWLSTVQLDFSLLLETFQLTVAIVDRYLQLVTDIPRNKLQLVGLSALSLACKYEEIYAPALDDFTFISDEAYTKEDIIYFEKHIFRTLGFKLAIPLPIQFLRRYMKIESGKVVTYHMAKYFIDLCLCEYEMASVLPSKLAAAAHCLATFITQEDRTGFHMSQTLKYFSGYNVIDLKDIIINMTNVILNAKNRKIQAVYQKYSQSKLAQVSILSNSRKARIQEAQRRARYINPFNLL